MVITALVYTILSLIFIIIIVGLWLLYYARDFAAPIPPAVPGTIRIACVGDSITYGALVKNRKVSCYPARLEKLLGNGYSVRNFGVNGHSLQKRADKPYWDHPHFKASRAFAPNYVLIMLGTNDSVERNWQGIDAYIADYREFIDVYRTLPSKPVIYLMTPPTQFSVENYTRVIHDMRNRELDEMTAAIKKLGTELDLGVIDINDATKNHPECFKFDGIHPDADGARIIADTVYEFLVSTGIPT